MRSADVIAWLRCLSMTGDVLLQSSQLALPSLL